MIISLRIHISGILSSHCEPVRTLCPKWRESIGEEKLLREQRHPGTGVVIA